MSSKDTESAVRALRLKFSDKAKTAVILGSGLSLVPTGVRAQQEIHFKNIPGFPVPRVSGHPGRFVMAGVSGKPVFLLFGRCHFYEGHDFQTLSVPFETLAGLGVERVIATFACGSLSPRFRPGDLVLVRDHINFMAIDFLRGVNAPGEFFNPGALYDHGVNARAIKIAKRSGFRVAEAVYAGASGPTYETSAEASMMSRGGGRCGEHVACPGGPCGQKSRLDVRRAGLCRQQGGFLFGQSSRCPSGWNGRFS